MEMVSLDQSHEVMAKVGTNCHWDEVGSEQALGAYKDSKRLGSEFTKFLQNGGRTTIMMTDGIILPPGGMIQILSVPVDESRPWPDAVKAAGPNTGRDWDIQKVGDQYPPIAGDRPRLKQVIIANFGEITQSEEALTWGKEQKLKPTTPRACFAISEHFPALHHYLGMDPLAVVTLAQCSCGGNRHVPCVWFPGAERKAYFRRFGYGWDSLYWFAFDRE